MAEPVLGDHDHSVWKDDSATQQQVPWQGASLWLQRDGTLAKAIALVISDPPGEQGKGQEEWEESEGTVQWPGGRGPDWIAHQAQENTWWQQDLFIASTLPTSP